MLLMYRLCYTFGVSLSWIIVDADSKVERNINIEEKRKNMKITDGFILDTVGGEYVAVSLDYSQEHFSGMIKLTGVSA